MIKKFFVPLGFLGMLAFGLSTSMTTGWPPEFDASDPSLNPDPTQSYKTELFMEELQVALPTSVQGWFRHTHSMNQVATTVTVGDLFGPDNHQRHLVLDAEGEAVLAGRLMGPEGGPYTFQPLFFWLSPHAQLHHSSPPGNQHGNQPVDSENALIWDFDNDGENEVAVLSAHDTGEAGIFILEYDPNGSIGPQGIREPRVVASTPKGLQPHEIDERLDICNVSQAGGVPRDILTHGHGGSTVAIWSYDAAAASAGPGLGSLLDLRYKLQNFGSPPKTLNASVNVGTHEISWADVDGDGFDEFFHDGCLDFVDSGGPTNSADPECGVKLWSSGYQAGTSSHHDQMFIADWDPGRPGLELLATTETTAPPGAGNASSIFYDPLDGTILSTNQDYFGTQSIDPQQTLGGSFAPGMDGMQAIFSPKDPLGPPLISPPGSDATFSQASYAIDAANNELVINGLISGPGIDLIPGVQIATGPVMSGPKVPWWQIDWDGDYSVDEIATNVNKTAYVFRMGHKSDLTYKDPYGVPEPADLVDGASQKPIYNDGTTDYYHFYYQGNPPSSPEPGWNDTNGGPGQFTHYYEKLGEAFARGGRFQRPYDLIGDHREELIVFNQAGLFVYRNPEPLVGPRRVSPNEFDSYRLNRMAPYSRPFSFRDLPSTTLELRPANASLPTSVAGVRKRFGTIQLQGILHEPGEAGVDVTSSIELFTDDPGQQLFDLDTGIAGEVEAQNIAGSACIRARHTLPSGVEVVSNPFWLLSSPQSKPHVLMAGYQHVDTPSGEELLIQALVAQKNNLGPFDVTVVRPDNSYWQPHGSTVWLVDDGSGGDPIAGDGIYSARIAMPSAEPDGGGSGQGDETLLIKAAVLGANVTFYDGTFFQAGPDFIPSDPWPYVGDLSASPPASCTGGGGPVPIPGVGCDGPPAPLNQNHASGPRILYSGGRGMTASNRLFLEAVVEPISLYIDVFAEVPWSSTPVVFAQQGEGRYTLDIPIPAGSQGNLLIPIRAEDADTDPSVDVASDWAPYLFLD